MVTARPDLQRADLAIEEVLQKQGLELAGTAWIMALGEGLYEFRVRHDASTIRALYSDSGASAPTDPSKILLRLFIHFHGQKIILLLHGYNKAQYERPASGSERGGLVRQGRLSESAD